MDMIQVCCQSWFIFAQTDGEIYVEADVQTDGEIIVKNIVKNMFSKQIVKYMDKYMEKQMLKQMVKIIGKNVVYQILNLMMKNIFSTFSLYFQQISSNAPVIAPVSSRKPLKPRNFVAIKYKI